jgi:hypothetical protein
MREAVGLSDTSGSLRLSEPRLSESSLLMGGSDGDTTLGLLVGCGDALLELVVTGSGASVGAVADGVGESDVGG